MQFHVSTDSLADRDRFAVWADAVHSTLGLDAEPSRDAAQPFRGTLSARSTGPLLHLSATSDAHRVYHRSHGAAPRSSDGFRIYREASVGVRYRFANMEGVTRLGDLIVYDSNLPFETQPLDGFRLVLWTMPKALLEPHLPALGRPLATVLSGRAGVEALAGSYLDALSRNWDTVPEAAMPSIAETLARLIGIACGAAAAEQSDAVRAGRLVEARRHIDRHLADPDLSPACVAAALAISIRSLHALFEPSGTSFARYVLRRRLEECRAALLANPARAVTDIAFAWGFSTLSGFYRGFQAAFGMSPGDLRAASRAGQ